MNEELTDKYLSSIGMKRTSGKKNLLSALLPFIIMDEEHDIFLKNIYKADLKHELRQLKNEWSRVYTEFNKGLFKAFNEEEQGIVQDKMDSFHEYIHNYVVMLRLELRKVFAENGVGEEKMDVLINGEVCNVLQQASNIIWKANYFKNSKRGLVGADNPYLVRLISVSHKFVDRYHGNAKHIDLNTFPKAIKAMQTLCNKTVAWLKVDGKNEE